ncbi:sialidase family protein [Parapedobacter sp. 10938]|uniref:sialidase family protein n=1 Tax=Parapedobacter flavus TaxID=3110225 RepID=UPI002DBAAA3B|nr:sialidase family protein [Parapedobacter sp. 10938]MEC3878960.1 sialidase family protein [Parapedobacter sp. 10938]
MLKSFVFLLLLASCQKQISSPVESGDNASDDNRPVPVVNLISSATVTTLHPAHLNRRFVENIKDGRAGVDADHGWVPRVTGIKEEQPVLLALSWDKPVTVDRVILKGFQSGSLNWYATDYIMASWNAAEPLMLEAPAPKFDHTDVFVGGEDGYHTYRIPALVVSKQGTMLAFCEGRRSSASDVGDIDLLLKRSTDNGHTWGEQQLVYGEDGEVTIGNPVPIADQVTGDIHMIYSRNEREVWYVKSSDDGVTFSAPVNITEAVAELCRNTGFNWGKVWTGPGHGLQLADGRLVVPLKPAGTKQGNASRRVGVIVSDDHGKTWKPGGIVPPTIGEMSESTVFESGDGTLVMNMRWHDGLYRAVSKSYDRGITWSDPEAHTDLQDPVCQGSVIRYSADKSDKRVLFSNLNHQETGTAMRGRLTVKLSTDDGERWLQSKEIVPGPAGYSDLAITKNGGIAVFFESGTEIYSQKLTIARLNMQDFDVADRPVPPGSPRYDIALAKTYPSNLSWKEQLHIKGNKKGGTVVHSFDTPFVTHTLLLYVYGVEQPQGYAYLQELEVWGRDSH